jgi:hypothetical protein
MTKQITWMFVLLFGISSVFVACKKKGCTDPAAKNYCEKCKKDDGTCQYVSAEDLAGNWQVSGTCGTHTMSISGSGSSVTLNRLHPQGFQNNGCYIVSATLSKNVLTIPTQTISATQSQCGFPYSVWGSGTITAPSYNRIDLTYTVKDLNGGYTTNCSATATK